MGPFVSSYGMKYIHILFICVSNRVEAFSLPNNEDNNIIAFLKNNSFSGFGTSRAIISDGGSHIFNKLFKTLLEKYGFRHNVASPYHPQTSGLVELSNRDIKQILAKIVNANRMD